MPNPLIILDRDGVINKLLNHPIRGLDSPMSLEEIEVFPWVSSCLKRLKELGFYLSIATNQPAWAKGKIDKVSLENIHNHIMKEIQSEGAVINSYHICFHKKEDLCECRKPKTLMLRQAMKMWDCDSSKSWMIGDRAVDIMAGANVGLQTALLNALEEENDALDKINLIPTFIGNDLRDFVAFMERAV